MLPRLLGAIAMTLVPLAGLTWWGWDWREIIVLLWLENVTLGILTVIGILRIPTTGDATIRVNGRATNASAMASKLFVAGFFTFHYGLFTLVHGIFILAFAGGAMDGLTAPFGRLLDSPGLDWGRILLVWCIATAVQVAVALIQPQANVTATGLMVGAYARMIPLHIGIILASFLTVFAGFRHLTAVVLIAMRAVAAVIEVLLERRLSPPPAPTTWSPTTG